MLFQTSCPYLRCDFGSVCHRRPVALLAAFILSGALFATVRPAHAEKWALLIGIDSYKDSRRNERGGETTAAADARGLQKALIEADGFPEANIKLLVSDASSAEQKPERNAILREMASLTQKTQAGDTVFVFFSGQGVEKNGVSYLLPYDADTLDADSVADTAIETAKFRNRLQNIRSGLLLIALDVNGIPARGESGATPLLALIASQFRGLSIRSENAKGFDFSDASGTGPRAVVTIFSCTPGEQSYPWTAKSRGYFSYFLEQGLRGAKEAMDTDGAIRATTLTRYLSESVSAKVKQDQGAIQTPFAEIRGQMEASRIALATPGKNTSATDPISDRGGGVAAPILATDKRAYLQIDVEPANAGIFIDGERKAITGGQVAVDLKGAQSQAVEVGIVAKGFESKVVAMTLQRATLKPLKVALERIASVAPSVTSTPSSVTERPATTVPPSNANAVPTAIPVPSVPSNLPPPSKAPSDTYLWRKDFVLPTTPPQRWALEEFGAASAKGSVEGDVLKVNVTAVDGTYWHTQMWLGWPTLTENGTYVVSFEARAEIPHTISVIGNIGGEDYHHIGLLYAPNALTKTWTTFRRVFVATRTSRSSPNRVPIFQLGTSLGTVWIRNVTVRPLDAFTNPTEVPNTP